MVKVKEFCCGCSLRSGTFTIAWTMLIYSAFLLISNVYKFLSLRREFAEYQDFSSSYGDFLGHFPFPFPSLYTFTYHVIRLITGIAVSITALWALHKNKIIFLNGLYWYLCFTAASFILSVILLIFEPSWEEVLVETNTILSIYSYNDIEMALAFSIIYLFIAGIVAYFTLIVKSYRDYGLINEAQNVQFVGPDATTVGYIAA